MVAGFQLSAGVLSGGTYSLVGGPGGGGTSAGGGFNLTGWAASAGAGVSTGDTFELACGLIGVYAVQNGDVVLKVEEREGGQVRLWWAATGTDYQLEFTPALGPDAVWRAVTPPPTANEYVTVQDQPARFFRLRQP